MKSKVKVERAEKIDECKCSSPDLINRIDVALDGHYFIFCRKCRENKRLSQQDIDQMIREKR